jgi:hypothetical protein
MEPENSPIETPKGIPIFYNIHKIATPNFTVTKFPKLDKEALLGDLMYARPFSSFELNLPALEYIVMRRDSVCPDGGTSVRLEFDQSIDKGGNFCYTLRNVTIQNGYVSNPMHQFVMYYQIPDVSLWSRENIEEFREKLTRQQEEKQKIADTPIRQELRYKEISEFEEQREELFDEVMMGLCESPWSPQTIETTKKFLEEEVALMTGHACKMGAAGDVVRRAFTELRALNRFRDLDDMEQGMIIELSKKSYAELQNFFYDITYEWNKRNLLSVIKLNVYMEGRGEEVDWSQF